VVQLAPQCTEAAIGVLQEIAACRESQAASAMAATPLLVRGWRKPKQGVEVSGGEGVPPSRWMTCLERSGRAT
jgi:hypothetical protein